MILLRNLALARGPHPLFAGVSLTLERGWRVGLVGANGSGKTSLLAQLAREIGEIRAALADPSLYESPDPGRVAEALASAEQDWLHASARLEALRDEAS